jgi:hypothetical protein
MKASILLVSNGHQNQNFGPSNARQFHPHSSLVDVTLQQNTMCGLSIHIEIFFLDDF